MLGSEQEKALQKLGSNLGDEELLAIFALSTHIDEMTHLRGSRCYADAEVEKRKPERLVSSLAVGFHYGEGSGTIKTGHMIVEELARMMTCPVEPKQDKRTLFRPVRTILQHLGFEQNTNN